MEETGTGDTVGGLPTVEVAELPPEARTTLDLIERGGPYPYAQDDGTFFNREGLLPDRPEGHYREYTVETPGSPDRGARRIVAGSDGERFWTDDHYASFWRIIE
ncbi:ribonuclease [Nocardioides coralli]|nr:ribonuclease [Nocardioides coralli]